MLSCSIHLQFEQVSIDVLYSFVAIVAAKFNSDDNGAQKHCPTIDKR